MKKILHTSSSRGYASHGWLSSFHTFSFASYYEPTRMHFGALRVLNDDTVSGGMGFGKHPHDNMEIVSIPLSGDLEHQDSMGNKTVITQGEVQIMSAGTGIYHSEKNKNSHEQVKFLQIWVFPKVKNIQPRYDQKAFDIAGRLNAFQTVVSPIGTPDDGVKMNQDAWFSLIRLEAGKSANYALHLPNNGVYAFVLSGNATIADETLAARDGLGITEATSFDLTAQSETEILFMEVPMALN